MSTYIEPTDARPTAPSRLWAGGYPTWLVSDTSFELSSALAGFAVPLLALMVTDDPVKAGVIGAAGVGTRVVASLVGGVLADRHNRVRMMLAGAAVGLVIALLFTWAATGSLTFTALLALNVAMAARNGLFGGATQAALKDIVPADALGRAQASNQGRDAVIALAGSPLGGVLLGLGAPVLGVVLVACQLVAAGSAALLSRWARQDVAATGPESKEGLDGPPTAPGRRFLGELADGFRWVFSRPDLRGALLVSTLINLGFNAAVSTVVYSMQQSGSSPTGIGLVSGGLGLGMLAGALVAPILVARVPAGRLAIGGLVLLAVGTLALPFVTHPLGITVLMAVSIAGAPALNAALLGYFMVATPSALIGRATGAITVFATGAMPLAPLIAGVGLGLAGRGWTLVLAAAICLAATMLAASTRGLRELPAEAGWAAHAERQ
ncbi:MAG TPA: MFS transporter [Arachnia sp.]|nr:MFS transporter [Arachnia sp.]